MREMDVKSEDLREKLRTTEAAAADAESGAAVVRTQLANNAETLLRLQREIGEQKERAGGLSRQVGEHRARIESIAAERRFARPRILAEIGNFTRTGFVFTVCFFVSGVVF